MKLFVDKKRTPSMIYSDPNNWIIAENNYEFNSSVNESLVSNDPLSAISFDYDLENKAEGLLCLSNLITMSIKLRLTLPKIYLHCNNRRLAIDFENALNEYTRKTNVPYAFEYTKRN